jgi:type II secretory ATPase GspE/PulE/Tfp pilus assembly ATPase PilB-like protein
MSSSLTSRFLNKCTSQNLLSKSNIIQHGYELLPLVKLIGLLEENKIVDIEDIYRILAELFEYQYVPSKFLKFEELELTSSVLIKFMVSTNILIYKCESIVDYYKFFDEKKIQHEPFLENLLKISKENQYLVVYSECYSPDKKSLIHSFFYENFKNVKYSIGVAIPSFVKQEVSRIESFKTVREVESKDAENLVLDMLKQALYKYRASDIHLEPKDNGGDVRFRVDGILKRVFEWDKETFYKVARVLFLNANVDADKKQYIHDSKVLYSINNNNYEFRFSAIPTNFGPSIVLRQYTGLATTYKMENLGFTGEGMKILKKMMFSPYGIFLISGPTGSGKTSTLYSMILELGRSLENKVLTVEDPVELNIPFAIQAQVSQINSVTFASTMRSFLRHDPDIILVGEIRDLETANEAVTAANTGHLVFSTIHTNTSLEIITRLLSIGLERWKITSSLLGGMGQRLYKLLCFNCKKPISRGKYADLLLNNNIFLDDIRYYKDIDTFYISDGCEKCGFSRYTGRTVIYEVFETSDEFKDLIERGCSFIELKRELNNLGFKSMLHNSTEIIKEGKTSVEDMFRLFGSYLYRE